MSTDMSELASELQRQGMTLCLTIGSELVLERFGFQPGQQVVIRFTRGRVEIRPRGTAEAVKERLKLKARDLRDLAEQMRDLARELPAHGGDRTVDGAEGLEEELVALVECLLVDNLEPAIRRLEEVDGLE
ncbi:MAG TPA: hypothetical protein VIE43_19310 [Thermoanaerobaculia bacterium]|jgi:hypothetical protein|nr:hypothetical protein [Thermoanaerobaculia bacterium]